MNLLSPKKSLILFEERLYESTSRKCFVPAAQRPNMAVLSESEVRAKFTRILWDSVTSKCWRLLGNEDVVGSRINSNLWKVRLLVVQFWSLSVPTITYVTFMIHRPSGTCPFDFRCRVQSHLRCSFMNLSWLQRVRNTWKWCSVTKIIEFGGD